MGKRKRKRKKAGNNSKKGTYTDKAHDAGTYFMNLASEPSKKKGMRRPKRPENMDSEELENAVSAYNKFKKALGIAEEYDGPVEGEKRKMYDALLAIGRNFSRFQEEAKKAIEEAEKEAEKEEPVVEAEYVEDKEPEYNPFSELIHVQTEEEGETELSADELEFYSMKKTSIKELIQITKGKIENMKQRYDGMIERAKKMLEMEGYSGILDGYREVMTKNSEMIERYGRIAEKGNDLLEKQADIRKALIVNDQHDKEMTKEMHATEREITQFWLGRIHERMDNIKEKQANMNKEIDAALQSKT